tara:strand:- start:612 stop:818 length:207 start_codon:yes stop_codon:yes gene_type:complete
MKQKPKKPPVKSLLKKVGQSDKNFVAFLKDRKGLDFKGRSGYGGIEKGLIEKYYQEYLMSVDYDGGYK